MGTAVRTSILASAALAIALSGVAFAQNLFPIVNPLLKTITPGLGIPQTPEPEILGTISGRVALGSGAPAVGFTVRAVPAKLIGLYHAKNNPSTAVTDADGRYTLILHPWNVIFFSGPVAFNVKGYDVFVSNGGQPYVEPSPLNVDPDVTPDHNITAADLVLRLGPLVTIHARDAITGAPDPGVSIQAENDFDAPQGSGVTGADGILRLRVSITNFWLKAALPKTMEAAPGYGAGQQSAREITTSPGQEITWNIKTYSNKGTINEAGAGSYGLDSNSDWHGVVLLPDGKPAAGASVHIYREYPRDTETTTDARGQFSVSLPRINYGECDQWLPDNPPTVFAELGDLRARITATPDQTWDGMRLQLVAGQEAGVVGRAVDPSGKPMQGVPVMYDSSPGGSWQDGGVTDSDGRFTLSRLIPGIRYFLGLGGRSQFPSNPGLFAETMVPVPRNINYKSELGGGKLTLRTGEIRDIGHVIVYPENQVISGQIVTEDGQPVEGPLYLEILGEHTRQYVDSSPSGRFHDIHVVDEPLTIKVYRVPTKRNINTNPGSPDLLIQMPILLGQKEIRLTIPTPAISTLERY